MSSRPEVFIAHSAADVPPETDLVVVLGKNVGQDWSKERDLQSPKLLSTDSMINVQAAASVWIPGRKIVFSGGQKLGEDLPYQGESAARYFREKFPHVPDEDILTETTGYSTPKSAEALSVIAKDLGSRSLALLSVGYHLEYAPQIFAQFDVPVASAIASEDILAERSSAASAYIAKWRGYDRIRREYEYSVQKRAEVEEGRDFQGQQSDARTRQRVYSNESAEGGDRDLSQPE